MSEQILNEILINVNETKEEFNKMRNEAKEEFNKIRNEIKEEFNKMKYDTNIKLDGFKNKYDEKFEKLKREIVEEISSDIGKQLNQIMIVISKVENEKHQRISKKLEQHQEKAIKGVELLKQTLVS